MTNIPRLVIIGGGFAGLNIIKKLDTSKWEIVLIDRDNYHAFPPLFYQVASGGLDPASISFPLRRELRKRVGRRVRFHMGVAQSIDTKKKEVRTPTLTLQYDKLIIAAGTTNNFFNMAGLSDRVYTLKSTSEALRCRNDILRRLERAAWETDPERRRAMLHFVVIGGGPTGVEVAGALGEMKRYVLPREYPTIPQEDVTITVVEGAPRLLATMSEKSSRQAEEYLRALMVTPRLGQNMKEYGDDEITLTDGTRLPASMVVWTAGVTGVKLTFEGDDIRPGRGGRLPVDAQCRLKDAEGRALDDVYAVGDISLMIDGDPFFPGGHPQLAQVAIQQGRMVAHNLTLEANGSIEHPETFRYDDKGCMATVGRNRAVVDLNHGHFGGFAAWLVWMFIHLISILGMRNKISVLINWIWAYFNYSTSLRLLIRPSDLPLRTPKNQQTK